MRHGFLLICKEAGPTSHDVVAAVRRTLQEPKVGHLGTLDPQASGLLALAVGAKALKVIELFAGVAKEYLASVKLGAVSTTDDAEGRITHIYPRSGWQPPADASRIAALIRERFVGKIAQVPSLFSAVHVGGERAYRKAQRNEAVTLAARQVTIHSCEVVHYAYPDLRLQITCGAGMYVRSLARDLGKTLRCGAYLAALERTRVGEWELQNAIPLERVTWAQVIPLKAILAPFPAIELRSEQWDYLKHGRAIAGTLSGAPLIAWHEGLPVAWLEQSRRGEGVLKARKVL